MWQQCSTCGKIKALWMFSRSKRYKFGVRNQCKKCQSLSGENYRNSNIEKLKVRKKIFYENNKEQILLHCSNYKKSNYDKVRLSKKKEYHKHKEAYSHYHKLYYIENKDEILLRLKYYYENNKDKVALQKKHYRDNNKDKKNSISAKRRALQKELSPVLTPQQQQDIQLYYTLASYLSGFGTKYHVDHIIPIAKGGLHHPDNLQVITEYDNCSKGAKLNYKYKDEVFSLKV